MNEAEHRLLPYREHLLDPLPADKSAWGIDDHLRECVFQLLDFHRRAAKPQWWAMFDRQDMTPDERHDDPECIAGLISDPEYPPQPVARSIRYTYLFPDQETKLKTGDSCVHVDSTYALNELTIDEPNRRVSFKRNAKYDAPATPLDIGLGGPVKDDKLREAIFRYADALIAREDSTKSSRYTAIDAVLRRDIPKFRGKRPRSPIVDDSTSLDAIAEAVSTLDDSYLFIQGPPGAGKTYTGSKLILSLLKQGKRVGVSSNSHKAINNLLGSVEKCAQEENFRFSGAKKSGRADESDQIKGQLVKDFEDYDDIVNGGFQLLAGTAWLFCRPELDGMLDYLFVDEAGQVALGNLVAMATSARNIVLLGDQMQLSQPTQ